MMKIFSAAALIFTLMLGSAVAAQARADTVSLYTEAVMTGDIPALETLLAPNYWHINANGHIQDKEHFTATIKNKEMVIDRLSFTNARTTIIGDATLITGNGTLRGRAEPPLPQGLMRFTLVLVKDKGRDEVVLFQATPVIPSVDCADGNCKIQ